MKFAIIAAADKNRGIGIGNKLPWRLAGDLKYFSEVTTRAAAGKINAVIMGRKTWESLPEKHRPLAGRLNVVLSRSGGDIAMGAGLPAGVILAASLEDAFEKLSAPSRLEGGLRRADLDQVFVIGGASIYEQAINHPDCEKIYLTEVLGEFNCDAFFPSIPDSFIKESISELHEEKKVQYRFVVYGHAA